VSTRLGVPRAHFRLIDSTNARARELALQGAPHGTIVTAFEQSAGRGRQGRAWAAPPGRALLLSVIVRGLSRRDLLLPLAVPVAVADACERIAGVHCTIKWPNDIWIGDHKVAGILLEGRPQEGWAVLGIGINVGTKADEFPDDLHGIATSLAIESDTEPEVEDVLAAVLEVLEARLADKPASILKEWRERDALLGRSVRWTGGEGIASGLDESGSLLVETEDGQVALDAGEVHLQR
jgi:BirA family biotin operon repressor/biotin-[acetyl-CoA-carboxylase] ligase